MFSTKILSDAVWHYDEKIGDLLAKEPWLFFGFKHYKSTLINRQPPCDPQVTSHYVTL